MTRSFEPPRAVLVPTVVESTSQGERRWSIFDRLLRDRIVFLGEEIDDALANVIIAQLLFLESEDPEREVMLYINSPGGAVYAMLAIFDTMQHLRCPVSTMCVGLAASSAAVLLAAGRKGLRTALPNARVMIHQPHGGARGQVTDIEIQAREAQQMKEVVTRILADATGRPREEIARDIERDKFLGAEAACEYGLVDRVLAPRLAQAV